MTSATHGEIGLAAFLAVEVSDTAARTHEVKTTSQHCSITDQEITPGVRQIGDD